MAFITLSGTLLDPNGDLAVGDQIRFTHKSTTGETVESAVSIITINPAGTYSLPLQYGLVLVEYKDVRTQQFKNLGVATVNQDNPATSIPELLNALVPASSAELIEFQAILADCVAVKEANEALIIDLSGTGGASLVGSSSGATVQQAIDSLSSGQAGGVIVFTTYALLSAFTPTTTEQEQSSYKVTNDVTASLNGFYHWVTGSTYAKDSDLVSSVVSPSNTSEGVSGSAIDNYTGVRTNICFSDLISDVVLTPDFFLKSDGTSDPFPGAGYSQPIYIYENGLREINYNGKYGGTAVGLLFRNISGGIISSTSQVSNVVTWENVPIPSTAYTVEISTTRTVDFEVKYNELNLPSLSDSLNESIDSNISGLIELSPISANDVYLNSSNELISLAGSKTWNEQSVVPGSLIRYDTKFGSAAVGVLFIDNTGGVISFASQASNTFSQGFIAVPDNAIKMRVSTTDRDTPTVISYVDKNKRSSCLSGLSWEAIGDSITEGSEIRSNEGIDPEAAKQLTYCGLIGSGSGMSVVNNGKAGTRVASFNPYGRTISYLTGTTVIGYDEIHYLPLNTANNGKVLTTPAGCDHIRLTIAFTDSVDANNSIADLSALLIFTLGEDLSASNLYSSANNISGARINYDGELKSEATGVYVDIPVSQNTLYAFSDLYEFSVIGAFRYNSFVERLATILSSNTDIKTIMGGTNDRVDYIIGNKDSVSPYEFKGALNIIIKAILDDDATTKIGLMTLLRFNTEAYIDELGDATLDVGSYWSVPVLDMRKNSGINVIGVDDITQLSYDAIHPNINGNIKMKGTIEKFIGSL